MSRPIAAVLCAVAASLVAAGALADDSTAGLSSGGIELRKSDGIEMRREDLYLSMRAVHAAFRFRNVTGRDIDTIVAFPVPDVMGLQLMNQGVDLHAKDSVNFLGFKTWVDGKPVKVTIEQKAFVDQDVDRSADLRRLGLPLNPAAEGLLARLEELPQATKDELLRLKLVDEGYDDKLRPTWWLKTTYWWRQVFPAGRDLRIDHRYVPSLSNANADLGEYIDDQGRDQGLEKFAQENCIDLAVLKSLAVKARKPGPGSPTYSWYGLDYVLTSGANWRGPIRDFRLVVEKADPRDVLSFCAPGLRVISPTQVAWRKRDFVPDEDLSVGFLTPDVPYPPVRH
jgi:hypothetical protein